MQKIKFGRNRINSTQLKNVVFHVLKDKEVAFFMIFIAIVLVKSTLCTCQ